MNTSKRFFILSIFFLNSCVSNDLLRTPKTGLANVKGRVISKIDFKPVPNIIMLVQGHDKCDFAGMRFDAASDTTDANGYYSIDFERKSYYAYTLLNSPYTTIGCYTDYNANLTDCYSTNFSFDNEIILNAQNISYKHIKLDTSYLGDSLQYFTSAIAKDTLGKPFPYLFGYAVRVSEKVFDRGLTNSEVDSLNASTYFIWKNVSKTPSYWQNVLLKYTKPCQLDTILIK